MKKLTLLVLFFFLIIFLVSCSDAVAEEPVEEVSPTSTLELETESEPAKTSVPTDIPPTTQPEIEEKDWPDALPFCRQNPDNPEGEADCWVLKSDEEWRIT